MTLAVKDRPRRIRSSHRLLHGSKGSLYDPGCHAGRSITPDPVLAIGPSRTPADAYQRRFPARSHGLCLLEHDRAYGRPVTPEQIGESFASRDIGNIELGDETERVSAVRA